MIAQSLFHTDDQSNLVSQPAPARRATKFIGVQNMRVYRRTLQALLYPISLSMPHSFQIWKARTSMGHCYECEGLIVGVAKQGLRCTTCAIKCHEKCKDILNVDCLQRAAEKTSKPSGGNDIVNALSDRMKIQERSKAELFELVRNIFEVGDETQNNVLKFVKQAILERSTKWSAKISVTVICARALMATDKTGSSDPYVIVQIGKMKKRTRTVNRNVNPAWNETFHFDCQSSTDRIKICVWDENDDLKSKWRKSLRNDSDNFLGQVLVDLRPLQGEKDLWCNLGGRVDKSNVSGSIHLRINVDVRNEENICSYELYTCLHEKIFEFYAKTKSDAVEIKKDTNCRKYFDGVGQEVLRLFSERYGIDDNYQSLTHFSCLSTKYTCDSVRAMSSLMADINTFHVQSTPTVSITPAEKFFASNFCKDMFTKLLDNVNNSLKYDIAVYRKKFISSSAADLHDLKAAIELLKSITIFKMKVLELPDLPKASVVVNECATVCLISTYRYLFENCSDLYHHIFDCSPSKSDGIFKADQIVLPDMISVEFWQHSVKFWQKLLQLMIAVIEEDRRIYSPVFDQFSREVNIGQLSATTFWRQFAVDLKAMLKDHADAPKDEGREYMNLYFRVKDFYTGYIANIPRCKETVPDFHDWFLPFMSHWLRQCDSELMDYLYAAYEHDKKDRFPRSSDHTLFSNSVVDVFTELNQALDVVKKMECPDCNVSDDLINRFAMTTSKVLVTYLNLVEQDFPLYVRDEKLACILLNNVQQLRVQLENLYEIMGGKQLTAIIQQILHDLQLKFDNVLEKLAHIFALSLESEIMASTKKLGKLLSKVDNDQVLEKCQVADEASVVLEPLMDFLENSLSRYVVQCEKQVLYKLLKELWKIVISGFEKIVLISSNVRVINDIRPSELTEESKKCLTPKECLVFDAVLETVKFSFHADGNGLSRSFLDLSSTSKVSTVSLNTHPTDKIIATFIRSQIEQDALSQTQSFGEINVRIYVYTLSEAGEHKIGVNIVSANDLIWETKGLFRPFVEVHIVGPCLSAKTRKFATKTRMGSWSPIFNESFDFFIPSEELENYELIFQIKNYHLHKQASIVGIGVFQLRNLIEKRSCTCWIRLGQRVNVDETGRVLLQILSQRQDDEIAQQFVKLMIETRSERRISWIHQDKNNKNNL